MYVENIYIADVARYSITTSQSGIKDAHVKDSRGNLLV